MAHLGAVARAGAQQVKQPTYRSSGSRKVARPAWMDRKVGSPRKVTPLPTTIVATLPIKLSRTGNPATWPRTETDISVSGLGAYRSYRSHQGKSFPSSKAVNYREPADASDKAVKAAHGKTKAIASEL